MCVLMLTEHHTVMARARTEAMPGHELALRALHLDPPSNFTPKINELACASSSYLLF